MVLRIMVVRLMVVRITPSSICARMNMRKFFLAVKKIGIAIFVKITCTHRFNVTVEWIKIINVNK